jgi:hypothetical protein
MPASQRHAVGASDRAHIAGSYTLAAIAERYAACWAEATSGPA